MEERGKRKIGRPRHEDPPTHLSLVMPKSLVDAVEARLPGEGMLSVQEYVRKAVRQLLAEEA